MLRLSMERQRRGWSKSELARRARMQPGEVGKIEAGRLRPYGGQLRKLARALGWPIDDGQRLLEVAAETAEPVTAEQ
jgi:ribosome-binding protein aMBF1 (putative translation factor)